MPLILLVFNVIATIGILSYAFGEFDPAENEPDEKGWTVAREGIDREPRAAGFTRREV